MLILASQSPRRADLLKRAGIPFVVRPASVDETAQRGERPQDYARRTAELKARAVEAGPLDIVLGADTTVVIDGEMLGKPGDAHHAARMLSVLSGRKHQVITGICLKSAAQVIRDWAVTWVWFAELSEREIQAYVASGEAMGKAGAYAIQGLASKFVERIDGGYSNVVGLPVALVYKYLRAMQAL
ncbi:MAG: Maf family protein [Acidobacteria bacterium]|nr:Maf family protein [Acidobacteriota bacterium]